MVPNYQILTQKLILISEGNDRETLYIADNYFLCGMAQNRQYLDEVSHALLDAGTITDICICTKELNFKNGDGAFAANFNAFSAIMDNNHVTVRHQKVLGLHGRYWIRGDKGFCLDGSLNGIGKYLILGFELSGEDLHSVKVYFNIDE